MDDFEQLENSVPTTVRTAWARARASVSKVPRKAWIVLAVFLFAALLMAMYTRAGSRNDATLRVHVQHNFRSAKLNLWIDGNLSYSAKLSGSARKKFGLIPETVQGSLTQSVPIASGAHRVRVNIDSGDGSIHEDTIPGDFPSGGERTLNIISRRSNLAINWQGTAVAAAAVNSSEPNPESGFLQRYGGSLMMTVIGSIVSAFTGFAIREFPKQLGSREKA